jgi:hypothetical protein
MMIDACTVRWMTFTTGCALTLTTALGGQSHAESLDASYTISFACIRVGDITATVVFGPNEYAMSSRSSSAGRRWRVLATPFATYLSSRRLRWRRNRVRLRAVEG